MARTDENVTADEVIPTDIATQPALKRLHSREQFMREDW